MGSESSKLSPHSFKNVAKQHTFDDGLSKATETTEDSTIVPSSPPRQESTMTKGATHSQLQHQSWRAGSRSVPDLHPIPKKQRAPVSQQPGSSETLERRDSDPCSAPEKGPPSLPVKCPPRQTNKLFVPSDEELLTSSPQEKEDASYLMRVYDTRTWEMYRRITESRRNSQYPYSGETVRKPNQRDETTSEWENLHENSDASGGHDMIFLFDFD